MMGESARLQTLDPSVRIVVLTDSGAIPSLYVRLLDPLVLTTGNYNVVHSSTANIEAVALSADVLILQRWFDTPIRDLAFQAKRRGVPVVYETDDNLLDLSEHSQNRFSETQQRLIREVAQAADLVTCSTDSLARFMSGLNQHVTVLKNYGFVNTVIEQEATPHLGIVNTDYFKLDAGKAAFFQALEDAVEQLRYRITFFGSLDPLAAELCRAHPDKVNFEKRTTDDRRAFLEILAASGVNVAAVPLSDTRQHAFKSDIKFLDYASIGVPGIYNNVTVFPDVVTGQDGLVCEDSYDGWFQALSAFTDPAMRAACGRRAHAIVEEGRSIDGYVRRFADILARLSCGERGASIAPPVQAPRSAAGSQPPPGLLWSGGDLYVYALGRRRHLNALHLVPDCLEAGLTFTDEEALPNDMPEGPELNSSGQLDELLRRARRPEPEGPVAGRRLRISWIAPNLIIGGGGHRNIIRCAYQLERLGHDVSLYFVETDAASATAAAQVRSHFYPIEGHVGRWDEADPSGDILVATHWSTLAHAEQRQDRFGEIVYFVQDFEPSFYAMGSDYVLSEATYRRGYYAITSGAWCEKFLRESFGAVADHFRFPVDRSIYYERPQLARENRLLFFAKPEMTRRCFELGVAALERLHRLRPDVEIGFYGSAHAAGQSLSIPVVHYGLLPGPVDLAELYARSLLGLVFSTTNPSLVPYEMMACGLPVADLRRPGNETNYGGRYDIAYLADPDPSRMAAELAALLDDKADLARRSAEGLAFAAEFPVEEEVGRLIESYMLRRVAAWSPERRRRAESAR